MQPRSLETEESPLAEIYRRQAGSGRAPGASDARLRRELAMELGLDDPGLTEELLRLGVVPDTAPAFEALPFLEVAWADGEIDGEERWKVLHLATAFGLELGRSCHAQIELWLRQPPAPALFEAWDRFARHALLRPEARPRAARVLEGTDEVARAAGGLLGIGRVSATERGVLRRIRALLEAGEAGTRSH